MKVNVGKTDRIIRGAVGAALIAAGVYYHSWVGGIIGAVLVATALLRFCPAYLPFGFSSRKTK